MTQENQTGFLATDKVLLEAEVSGNVQKRFIARYLTATGISVSPGNPQEFQLQNNKWGAECRIYFNSQAAKSWAESQGIHVESGSPYQADYKYRINYNDLWWELVEVLGFRLGVN